MGWNALGEIRNGGGRVIAALVRVSHRAHQASVARATAKAGVVMLAKHLAAELALCGRLSGVRGIVVDHRRDAGYHRRARHRLKGDSNMNVWHWWFGLDSESILERRLREIVRSKP